MLCKDYQKIVKKVNKNRLMKMSDRIQYAIDDASSGKTLSGLMHACFALEGTGKKLFGDGFSRDLFVKTFNHYLWVIEPMFACGINLDETLFKNIKLKKRQSSFCEILYEVFRCSFAHGYELPEGFGVELTSDPMHRTLHFEKQSLIIPDTIIYALCAAVIFSNANADLSIKEGYWLACGTMYFDINKWWGREEDARICFSTVNIPRVTLILDGMEANYP